MNGIMNKNQLTIVKEDDNIKSLTHKKGSVFDNCYRDCHNNYYRTLEYKCENDIQLTNIRNTEINN